jgi:DNA polymerase-3 subunit beta
MVTTDGHRLAYVERKDLGERLRAEGRDRRAHPAQDPRRTDQADLVNYEGEIGLGADENHIYFEVGPRLLISRTLTGQFPNYEMVMPKGNDKRAEFDTASLSQAVRRVALMADDRSHAIRFNLTPGQPPHQLADGRRGRGARR